MSVAKTSRGRRGPARRSRPRRGRRLTLNLLVTLGAIAVALFGGWVWTLDTTVRARFEGRLWHVPAHVFASPRELAPGQSWTVDALAAELRGLGYRPAERVVAGTFVRGDGRVDFGLRDVGGRDSVAVRVEIAAGRVRQLRELPSEAAVARVRLEPRLVGSVTPFSHEDRTPVPLHVMPELLLRTLLLIEDRSFAAHVGVDPKGIARALWANIRHGGVTQGGSTITQQLVKNLFLEPDRTMQRKLVEALMAMLLEFHYDKHQILEAYVNEVFLGQSGNRAIHGFALASEFWFGKRVERLDPTEIALLVGMVRAPSWYNPRRNPERAMERRNLVLSEMAASGLIEPDRIDAYQRRPVHVVDSSAESATPYAAFLDFTQRSLQRDFPVDQLTESGLRVHSTLDLRVQRVVDETLAAGLEAIEADRSLDKGVLQGAVVVVDAENGDVLAMAGGRDPGFAGFNRALDAARPVGSLMKPAVYLAALDGTGFHWMSHIDDGPLTVPRPSGTPWQPGNYDKRNHGEVTLLTAMSQSYNISTARLGMTVGVDNVISVLRRLGLSRPLEPFPSLLLGAVGLTPFEVAQMYQTLAAGGERAALRGVEAVADSDGRILARYPVRRERTVGPESAWLIRFGLGEVVRNGTARALGARFPGRDDIAGKTGTTDDYRDSWFAGFAGRYVIVVWTGRDDNRPTGLSGASGAMRIWSDIVARLSPPEHGREPPPTLVMERVDPISGGLSDEECQQTMVVPFKAAAGPRELAPCSGFRRGFAGTSGGLGNWLRSLFGGGDDGAVAGTGGERRASRPSRQSDIGDRR
jgi:penicillin-binding protein 1B